MMKQSEQKLILKQSISDTVNYQSHPVSLQQEYVYTEQNKQTEEHEK